MKDPVTEAAAPEAYDVAGFCRAFHISRPLFYRLLSQGRGPRIVKIGRRTIIRADAARAWLRDLERDDLERDTSKKGG